MTGHPWNQWENNRLTGSLIFSPVQESWSGEILTSRISGSSEKITEKGGNFMWESHRFGHLSNSCQKLDRIWNLLNFLGINKNFGREISFLKINMILIVLLRLLRSFYLTNVSYVFDPYFALFSLIFQLEKFLSNKYLFAINVAGRFSDRLTLCFALQCHNQQGNNNEENKI